MLLRKVDSQTGESKPARRPTTPAKRKYVDGLIYAISDACQLERSNKRIANNYGVSVSVVERIRYKHLLPLTERNPNGNQ